MAGQPEKPIIERERRFVVADTSILKGRRWRNLEQGYVWADDGYAIRARLESDEVDGDVANASGTITAKGPRANGERQEYEMWCDPGFARAIIARATWKIQKRRFLYVLDGRVWEIDEFFGDNRGLFIAEIEEVSGDVGGEQADVLSDLRVPAWVYKEVTDDSRFNNEELARNPVSTWSQVADWQPVPTSAH